MDVNIFQEAPLKGYLYKWKAELVMAPPVQAVNGMMININSTVEIDKDIEVTKAKIKIIKVKKAERGMFRSRVKWHEEEKKNNPTVILLRALRFLPTLPLLGGVIPPMEWW